MAEVELRAPDTLDLAERGRLALGVLTTNPEPANAYRLWQTMAFDTDPPHLSGPNWITCKFLESLPMIRAMCGDDRNLSVEHEIMRRHLDQIAEDGLMYEPPEATGFMRTGVASPFTNGRMMLAMLAWHERDGDPAWLERVDRMNAALAAVAIHRHDYAFHPPEAGYHPREGWLYTSRPGRAHFPYTPPEEPSRDQQGIEGAVKENANVLRAAARWYELSGDPTTLAYAGELARFYLLPSLWEDAAYDGAPGHEHGVFAGHVHGNLIGLRGLLTLAIAARDEGLEQLVRASYEHARRSGIPRMGWFPSWIGPARFGRPAFLGSVCEACAIADMVALAIQLSDAGAGDYWDDVDHYVRNQLVEQQSADRHLLLEVSAEGRPCQLAEGAETTTRDAIDRSLGAFSGFGEPTCLPASQFHGCCTGNGTQALYYAWEGVTRLRGDVIEVNLFLNRDTLWIGVDSYLPHEGKVVLRTKRAATLAVHVPGWVDRARLTSHVDDRRLAPSWVGNFAMFPGVPLRALVTLEFPVPEQRAVYSAGGTTYTCVFRGSTLVDVSPRRASPASCPLYRRDHLRSPAASMRTARRFVAEKIIRW